MNFDKIDTIFLMLFSGYTILNIVIPCYTADVFMYHIYLQENPFTDKVNFDFFAGLSRNSFLFPLGDRMFYICRYILGYRLGTILSYFSIIVLYYQIKNTIKLFIDKKYTDIICVISALIALLPTAINRVLGTYYIDLISLVLEMQLLYYAFSMKNIFKNKFDKYLLFFIAGITIAIKISNLVLLIPIGLYIIVKNIKDIKQIKWYEYFISVIVFIIPFATYMVNNYIQMDNALYPFLADVFTSQYFGEFECEDPRYGVGNFFEALIWPIVVMLNPRKGDESFNNNWVLGIGYIIAILYIISYILSKKFKRNTYDRYFSNNKMMFELGCMIVIMSVLWAQFMMGYQRYGIILSIMMAIFMGIITIKTLITSKNLVLVIVASCIFGCSTILSIDLRISELIDYYAYSLVYSDYNNGEKYKNFNYLFKDREKQKIAIDGVWGAIADDSGTATLVREKDTPIYILDKDEIDKNNPTKLAYKKYYDNINNNKVYIASLKSWFTYKIDELNKYGFKIVGDIKVYDDLNFLSINDALYVFEVEYSDEYVGKEINKNR